MVDSVLNGTRIMDDDGYIPSRAATFGAAGEGISEDFLALWLSTLILNVHPKKQPRAVGFLVARYVRATAHRCIRAFAQNMEERKRARQLGEKAFNHYVSHLGVSAICIWRVRAVEARVARMRLRTAVSRWLRDQLLTIVTAWREQALDTSRLSVAYTRIATLRASRLTSQFFAEWTVRLADQERKRLVLTRIVLRTQDRAMVKALQAWLQLAASLAIIKHLADKGLQRQHRTQRSEAFAAWQALHALGFRVMRKEDSAGRRWARDVAKAHVRFWADRTRHARLCNERGALIQNRSEATTSSLVLAAWHTLAAAARRRATVEAVLTWHHSKRLARGALALWVAHTGDARTERALLTRGLTRRARLLQLRTVATWWAEAADQRRLRVGLGRGSDAHTRLVWAGVFDQWVDAQQTSVALVQLHERCNRAYAAGTLGMTLGAWHATASREAASRTTALRSCVVAERKGARRAWRAFRAWDNTAHRCMQLARALEREHDRAVRHMAILAWHEHAVMLKRRGEKFERMLNLNAHQAVATHLEGWIAVHSGVIVRANKVLGALARQDTRIKGEAVKLWERRVLFARRVFELGQRATACWGESNVQSALHEWWSASRRLRVLRHQGRVLAVSATLRFAGRVTWAWHAEARAVRTARRTLLRLRERWGLVLEATHFGAWRQVAENTADKSLQIARLDTRLCLRLARVAFSAWADQVDEDRMVFRKGQIRDKVVSSRRQSSCLHAWRNVQHFQAHVRVLGERNMSRSRTITGKKAVARWEDVWLQERACKRNEAVIAAGRSTRVLQEAVRQWTSESTRLRKLRQGLSLLVAKHDFRESQGAMDVWSHITTSNARHTRLGDARLAAWCAELAKAVVLAWGVHARTRAGQGKGLARLETRVNLRRKAQVVDEWVGVAQLTLQTVRHEQTASARQTMEAAHACLKEWRAGVFDAKCDAAREARITRTHNISQLHSVVTAWHKGALGARRRVEGVDRVMAHWIFRAYRLVTIAWCEASLHGRHCRQVVRAQGWKRARAVASLCLFELRYEVLISRRVAGLRNKHAQRIFLESAAQWFELAHEAERQRKDFTRQVRRCQARVIRWGLHAWKGEIGFMRASYARAETVQSRTLSSRAADAVRLLRAHAAAAGRKRRALAAFQQRWYTLRCKNCFASWKNWCDKKLAVKGVLDQVQELM